VPRGDVARADLEAQGHTLGFPFEVLRAGLHVVAQVELDAESSLVQVRFQLMADG